MSGRRRTDKRRRLLARWGWVSLAFTVVVAAAVAVVNRPRGEAVPAAGTDVAGVTSVLSKKAARADVPIRFEDVTSQVGLTFHHLPGGRHSLLPEDMGSGVACGDYDGDGWTDVYLVNCVGDLSEGTQGRRDEGTKNGGGAQQDGNSAAGCRLYRNVEGVRFQDVTEPAGVGFVGQGMGASWGDFDNDGDLDLYVTTFGPNALYRNLGNGTFAEVADEVGVQDERFSAGCSWADYDRDGHLDLYVANYVDFVYRPEDAGRMELQYATEQPYTLNPSAYPPLPNSLFRNRGDGTFEEVASRAGVADAEGRSLSASWADLDNDGWMDLYVANDVSKNGVFRNRGDGTFEDIGPASLAADYRGAMGIAVADIDNDLDLDLLITHWIAQENALYRNMILDPMFEEPEQRPLWFLDSADELGLGQIALDMVGWATAFADLNNDQRRDLWLVNGSTLEVTEDHRRLVPQEAFIFWNRGPDGFVNVASSTWQGFAEPFVGRGAAQLDYDRDGRLDLVVLIHGGDALVLRNVSPAAGHWLRADLRQTGGNTFALGARVYVTAGGRTQMAEVGSSSSYLSQDELAPHFGLGPHATVDSLRIVWPDGVEELQPVSSVDRTIRFVHQAIYPVQSPPGS